MYAAELLKADNNRDYILRNWHKTTTPNMSEDIQVWNGVLYNCFESAANCYSDGKLLLSGQGGMDDYKEGEAPWDGYKDGITSAFIDSGVENVGGNAFCNCRKLSTVAISEYMNKDVTFTIGHRALPDARRLRR